MGNRPPTIQFNWTIHEVNELTEVLKEKRNENTYALKSTAAEYRDDDGEVEGWRVRHSASIIAQRDKLAGIIEKLTGEDLYAEDDERRSAVAAAQVDLAAQEVRAARAKADAEADA